MSDETPDETNPSSRLLDLVWPGGLAVQAVRTAAELGIAEELADGPRTSEELARAVGAHAPTLARLLRVLVSLELLRERDGRFEQTAVSETLRGGPAESTRPWAEFLGAPFLWRSWERLPEAVRTGRTPFDEANGASFYEHLAAHPEDARLYDEAMSVGAEMNVEPVVGAYDFSRFGKIVDVGGGRGSLLRGILEATPQLRGVLFDLPAVVAGSDLGASPVADRCEIVGGNAFDGIPAGADAYLLKSVIHGFDDEDSVRVLRRCREAITDGGRLLLVELVLPESPEPDPRQAIMDLLMFTLVPGRERTEPEFREILIGAGFALERVVSTSGPSSIVEAAPA